MKRPWGIWQISLYASKLGKGCQSRLRSGLHEITPATQAETMCISLRNRYCFRVITGDVLLNSYSVICYLLFPRRSHPELG
jgi:hypothetical protein